MHGLIHYLSFINCSQQFTQQNASPRSILTILNNILGKRYIFRYVVTRYNIDENVEDFTVTEVDEIKIEEPNSPTTEIVNKAHQLDDDDNRENLKASIENKRKFSTTYDDSTETVTELATSHEDTTKVENRHVNPQPTPDVTKKVEKQFRNKRQK